MAKVLSPLHSLQVRGRVGGIVYRRWRDVNTVGALGGSPGDSSKPAFIAWQNAAMYWGSISNNQRLAWNEYANNIILNRGPFKPKKRSGYISYGVEAYLANRCGESYPGDPPTTVIPLYPVGLGIELGSGGKWRVVWDSGQDGDYIQVKAQTDRSVGLRIYDERIPEIGFYDLSLGLIEWGTVTANKKARARCRVIRVSGQAGPWGYADYSP